MDHPTPTRVEPVQTADHPDLTDAQREGIGKVVDWYSDRSADQVFRLFGYAGTGKTFLLRHIVDALDVDPDRVLYGAYTGKAAHVMRSKGIPDARTIHSIIYMIEERSRAHLIALEQARRKIDDIPEFALIPADVARRLQLEADIATERRRLARPRFRLNLDSKLAAASLLVLDEVSMVDERMAHDLLSFGVRILVLGDPAQLPPVGGEGYFTAATPDHLLTQVHRSALDSAVTRIATAVRHAPPGDMLLGVHGPDDGSGRFASWTPEVLLGHDVVLCWTNKLRWTLIAQIRAMRGLHGAIPQMGDTMIVLVNDVDADVFNGQTFDVLGAVPSPEDPSILEVVVADERHGARILDVFADGFTGHSGEADARERAFRTHRAAVAATFGQAITVHKAQGSQWEQVMVLDQSPGLYHRTLASAPTSPDAAHAAARCWLYTAVTRAASRVTIVAPGRI